jgi:hypothetical protein
MPRGIQPRGADMISAVAIIASDDRLILDNGPGHEIEPKRLHEKTKRSEVAGVVRISCSDQRGNFVVRCSKTGTSYVLFRRRLPVLPRYYGPAHALQLVAKASNPPTDASSPPPKLDSIRRDCGPRRKALPSQSRRSRMAIRRRGA